MSFNVMYFAVCPFQFTPNILLYESVFLMSYSLSSNRYHYELSEYNNKHMTEIRTSKHLLSSTFLPWFIFTAKDKRFLLMLMYMPMQMLMSMLL